MELYETTHQGGTNHGLFTLFPLLKFFFVEPEMASTGSIYGYNACNIITFMYADFGYFWPLGIFVFFALGVFCYNKKIKGNSIVFSYFWSIALFAMLFSFYSYVFQYVYWVTVYPLILLAVHFVFGKEKRS